VRHDNGKGQQGDKRQDNGTGSTTTTTGGTTTWNYKVLKNGRYLAEFSKLGDWGT
jgi:predicted secreted protein